MQSPEYQQLVARYPAAEHIALSHRGQPVQPSFFPRAVEQHLVRSAVLPSAYPALAVPQCRVPSAALPAPFRFAGPLERMQCFPRRKMGPVKARVTLENTTARPPPSEGPQARAVESVKTKLAQLQQGGASNACSPALTFLGTGSSRPSDHRAVSALLLAYGSRLEDGLHSSYVLLDAGEGTYGQIYAQHGDRTSEIMRRLTAMMLTHVHADHHLGAIRILEERQRALDGAHAPPLAVTGAAAIGSWLKTYAQSAPLNFTFTTNETVAQVDPSAASHSSTAIPHLRATGTYWDSPPRAAAANGVCAGASCAGGALSGRVGVRVGAP